MTEQAGEADREALTVSDLVVEFPSKSGTTRALNGVDFSIRAGEVLGLIGESGSGKSMTALAILGLLPYPGRIVSGRITFDGLDLIGMTPKALRAIRGDRIGLIFQNPMTALNPVLRIGRQVAEPIVNHRRSTWRVALRRAVELLALTKVASPEERVHAYPHEMSGGMQQRCVISMAVACEPSLLIADEPTTALDVTIQAQILDLMKEIRTLKKGSLLFITHDLGVVAEMCDRVAIMYAGRIVETGDVRQIFRSPQHPYTKALLAAVPRVGQKHELKALDGQPPLVRSGYRGCLFAARCACAVPECTTEPHLIEIEAGHSVRCYRPWLDRE